MWQFGNESAQFATGKQEPCKNQNDFLFFRYECTKGRGKRSILAFLNMLFKRDKKETNKDKKSDHEDIR